MKISCVVEVNNRLLPSLALKSRRGQKSTLRIVSTGSSTDTAVILHQTNDNIKGTVYKVYNNVETVFSRFINEGKVTIRLKNPQVDLALKGDSLELKCFLKTLGGLLRKDSTVTKLPQLSNDSALRLPVTSKKTKLIITKRSDFPAGRYPTTLTSLQISDVRLKSIDSRVFSLPALQVLDLTNNQIDCLPKELGNMRLKELYLANNRLGLAKNWKWICFETIQNTLQLLDLSKNLLKFLPVEVGRLKNLVTFKVCGNEIVRLPPGIGRLKTLRDLSVAQNKIEWFPSSFRLLRLSKFDISENNFKLRGLSPNDRYDFLATSLTQRAAAVVLQAKQAYSPETLPQTLISYLDCFTICECGNPTLAKSPSAVVEFRGQRITASLVWDAALGHNSTMAFTFCSPQCMLSYGPPSLIPI